MSTALCLCSIKALWAYLRRQLLGKSLINYCMQESHLEYLPTTEAKLVRKKELAKSRTYMPQRVACLFSIWEQKYNAKSFEISDTQKNQQIKHTQRHRRYLDSDLSSQSNNSFEINGCHLFDWFLSFLVESTVPSKYLQLPWSNSECD